MFGRAYKSESGAIIIDGHHAQSTTQCVHCGAHFILEKKKRWCTYCNGSVCLRENCITCIPYEAKLDFLESKSSGNNAVIRKMISRYPDIERIGL
ncbi:MAG: hypothetical protein KGJ07_06470 [Patescibacteria group bacterium]|nr:hypothetical protein [Patescibacteria group bacterium]